MFWLSDLKKKVPIGTSFKCHILKEATWQISYYENEVLFLVLFLRNIKEKVTNFCAMFIAESLVDTVIAGSDRHID